MPIPVNDLKPKVFFIFEGQPWVVLGSHHLKMQQRRPTVQVKMRSLLNGKIIERNFAQSEVFEEADIERQKVKFLYSHRDQNWFSQGNDPSKRFQLTDELIGDAKKFLKPNSPLDAIAFNGEVINIEIPVKMDFKVVEAPPAIRGDTAQGGSKQVKIETGATLNAPLFINEGDIIRINTETGDYVERIEKGK